MLTAKALKGRRFQGTISFLPETHYRWPFSLDVTAITVHGTERPGRFSGFDPAEKAAVKRRLIIQRATLGAHPPEPPGPQI